MKTCQAVATYIVDRNGLFREGLSRLLQDTRYAPVSHGISIPATCLNNLPSDGNSLVIFGPDSIGAVCPSLGSSKSNRSYRAIVLFNPHSERQVVERFSTGADSFLLVTISAETLVKSLDLVMDGVSVLSPGIAALLASPMGAASERVASVGNVISLNQEAVDVSGFSERESLVLDHLMLGASNKMIARDLGIAEATVKVHVKAIFRKACLRNRTQVALWAIKRRNGEGFRPMNPALAQLDIHSSSRVLPDSQIAS